MAQLFCHSVLHLVNIAEIYGDKGTIKIPHFWSPAEIEVAGETHKFPLPTGTKPTFCPNSVGLVYEADAGFWSRFFPVYNKLREEFKANTIGDVRFARISFGFSLLDKARVSQKDLGGGSLLDVGCYTVMVAQLVFGEYPEKISATGIFADNGVDEAVFMTLHFSRNRVAQLACHAGLEMTNTAEIHGDKGIIRIPHFWCPTEINVAGELNDPSKQTNVAGETHQFPLPTSEKPMFHANSEGFLYEADAVRQSLLKGEKENPLMTFDDTLKIIGILDEVRRQIGVVYDADKE